MYPNGHICILRKHWSLILGSFFSANILNGKSEHQHSLAKIKSISCSQALEIRRISSTFQDYHNHSRKLSEQFINKAYKKDAVIEQIQNVDQLDRKQLPHQQKRHDKQCMQLSVTYSRSLPNLKDIIKKRWHISQTNQSCKETFSTLAIIALEKAVAWNKSLALISSITTRNL